MVDRSARYSGRSGGTRCGALVVSSARDWDEPARVRVEALQESVRVPVYLERQDVIDLIAQLQQLLVEYPKGCE